jgi:hypothetical protein
VLENIPPDRFVGGLAGGRGRKLDDPIGASKKVQERPSRYFGGEVGEILFPRQGEGHRQAASGTSEDALGHQAVRAFGKGRDDEQAAPAPRTSDPVEGLVDPDPDPLHIGNETMAGNADGNDRLVSPVLFAPDGGLALR